MTGTGGKEKGAAPRGRILRWLILSYAAVIVLLGVIGALTLYGLRQSAADLDRARQSLTQLENARTVEGAFSRYLLQEIARRINAAPDPSESEAAGNLRGALFAYQRTIAEEVAAGLTAGERGAERSEMVRAVTLAEIFETIETEAMLERSWGDEATGLERAERFLNFIIRDRETVFEAVIFEIMQDERAEAAAAFADLDRLRDRLVLTGGTLAAAFVLALAGFGFLFYRGLMRPIGALTAAVDGFSAAGAQVRAPEDLPGEFAHLSRRFNAMAAVIESDQSRLTEEVAARTADLKAANARLTRIDRSRRAFFANISHELRTPVTTLLGEAQIALRMPGDERGALERIAGNGGYLRRRLEDLLKLARSEDGTLDLQMAEMDAAEAAAEAAEAARAYAAANEVELTLIRGPAIPIVGDAGAIRDAAMALIDNAVKFSPPAGVVTVETTARGFVVTDQGPGFGAEAPEKLFERYAQTGQGRGMGGAGLGLAIVKWIADKHGATLSAGTGAEGGARIELEFPE